MYDGQGKAAWEMSLDSYGGVRQGKGKPQDCPFRFQGQYEDVETGLYYNRFRYYDPETGSYISQDLIRLQGGERLYGYVHNPNSFVDIFGLNEILSSSINWKGFSSTKDESGRTGLQRHFDKHGSEFGDITQNEYLQKSKAFGREMGDHLQEAREGNFIIKHNPETGEVFVGHAKAREIRSYYKDNGISGDAFEEAKKTAQMKSGCG